jgi:hypothetical protein
MAGSCLRLDWRAELLRRFAECSPKALASRELRPPGGNSSARSLTNSDAAMAQGEQAAIELGRIPVF